MSDCEHNYVLGSFTAKHLFEWCTECLKTKEEIELEAEIKKLKAENAKLKTQLADPRNYFT